MNRKFKVTNKMLFFFYLSEHLIELKPHSNCHSDSEFLKLISDYNSTEYYARIVQFHQLGVPTSSKKLEKLLGLR